MRSMILMSAAMLSACTQDSGVTKYNSDPEVWITSHNDGDEVLEGVTENFRGQVGDPNHAIEDLAVTWLVNGAETCPESAPTEAGVVACDIVFGTDGGEVSLEVRDPEGAGANTQVSLDVQPTNAPEAALTAPVSDGVYYAEQLITFQGTVSDTEDTISDLVVTIETADLGDLGFELELTTEGDVEAFGTLPEGEHAVRLRAVDTTGKEGMDSVVVTVGPPNSAPTCDITAPEDMSAGPEGEAVFFEGVVGDVDVAPDWLTVVWSSDKDGELGPSLPDSDGTVGFATGDLRVDTHRITMTVSDEIGATCTSSIYYTVGTPPVLTITAPASGSTLSADNDVVFEATVEDNEDPPNEVALQWESDLDGIFSTASTDSSGSITLTVDSLRAGDHLVTVTATDTDGLYVTETVALNLNQPPTAPTVAITPNPATTGQMLIASADGSEDPEGTGTITYAYTWFEDGVVSPESVSATYPASATAKHHTYSVNVTASDGLVDGAAGTAEVTVINSVPVLSGPILSAATVGVGETLTCSATVSDADAADSPTLTYAWSDGRPGTTYTVTPADPVGSLIECTVTADDADGGVVSASVSATVVNAPPIVDAVFISPDSGQVGDTLTCFAGATDPEGDTTTIDYAWSTGTTGASHLITDGDDPGDTLTCTATASDSLGLTGTGTATATVTNTEPVVGSVSVSPSTAQVGDMMTCAATATDADGDSPTITYAWSDGVTGTTRIVTSATAPGALLTCTATATDADGGSDEASAAAIIANTPPVLGAVSISPTPAYNDDTLVCSALATDADAGTPTVTYAWTGGATGDTLPLTSIIAASGDSLTCTATADDGDGGTDSGVATVIIGNRDPTVVAVLSPSTPSGSDTLTCSATGVTDPDDDATTATFAWTVDGAPVAASSTTTEASTLASGFAAGQTVACQVDVSDGKSGTATDSASVLILNTPPEITGVTLTPTTLTTNDSAVADATVSDADGDDMTLNYAFSVNGIVVQEGPGDTLDGTVHFDKGDAVFVTVTATDETGSDTMISDTVDVSNALPTAPGVTIGPTDPAVDDDIVCTITSPSSDDDGDPITYALSWTVDGEAFTGATTTTTDDDTVPASSIAAWDVWTCIATPNDGDDDGTPGTASLTIDHECNDGRVVETASDVDFVEICADDDTIGCTPGITDCDPDESPTMPVTLTHNYYVSRTEITQGQYQSLMGSNPSEFDECGTDCPVEGVSWNMAATYANAMSAAAGLTECYDCSEPGACRVSLLLYACDGYRLLTEAEWEIAGRCGEEDKYAGSSIAGHVAWYAGNSGDETHPVATKKVNGCGLYDMSGNVAEWVHDWYDVYTSAPVVDPTGPEWATTSDYRKIARGGSWDSPTDTIRISDRDRNRFDNTYDTLGFRVGRTIDVATCGGESHLCPASSCKQILDDGLSTGTGEYWLSIDGDEPLPVHCDMETDGGGWTAVGSWVPKSGYAMSAHENGLMADMVRDAHTMAPFHAEPMHFSKENMNTLFNTGSSEYLTLTGTFTGGALLVRFTKDETDAEYDAFRGVYDTWYMQENGFTAELVTVPMNANPLPMPGLSWTPVEISARYLAPGSTEGYHYLPDDITDSHQWLFRENADDIPATEMGGSSNVPSMLFIR